ncbi:MAG TPA: trypsin-like peptidase domain-containing protein [Gaiellaceae bacterium]|nr:trypsin-like peptidase domain-containing protein [Gaiellaceae bacterium]
MDSGSGLARMGSLVFAALLGGGAAVGISAAVGLGDGTDTVVTTVGAVPAATTTEETSFEAADTDSKSVQQIYEDAGPGVVQVTSTSVVTDNPFFGPQSASSLGSGFVVDRDGYIVTNFHVIDGAQEIEVNFSGDDRVPATIVGSDPSTDLAVLKIDAQSRALTPLPLGNSDEVHVGDAVVAIGNPFGLERSVTAGIISALQRDITAPNGYTIDKVIQTDAPINQGNSGGPLLNAQGEVIGVNSQIETETGGNVGIGFAVPVNTVKEVVSQIKESGKVEHAYLGVRMQDVTPELAETVTVPVEEGVMIVGVVEGSPADQAGLQGGDQQVIVGGRSYVLGGDIVTSADGQAVTSADDLRRIIMEKSPGDPMTLEIQRGQAQRTVDVTLGQQPAQPGG